MDSPTANTMLITDTESITIPRANMKPRISIIQNATFTGATTRHVSQERGESRTNDCTLPVMMAAAIMLPIVKKTISPTHAIARPTFLYSSVPIILNPSIDINFSLSMKKWS